MAQNPSGGIIHSLHPSPAVFEGGTLPVIPSNHQVWPGSLLESTHWASRLGQCPRMQTETPTIVILAALMLIANLQIQDMSDVSMNSASPAHLTTILPQTDNVTMDNLQTVRCDPIPNLLRVNTFSFNLGFSAGRIRSHPLFFYDRSLLNPCIRLHMTPIYLTT